MNKYTENQIKTNNLVIYYNKNKNKLISWNKKFLY